MPNQHIQQRLAGIRSLLGGAHQAGASMSAASKGKEREQFVDDFLGNIFPAPYRFGTGDATDAMGNRSGQLDVVVELPFLPSLALPGNSATRLYMAEGVGAVIEVKSNATKQWDEVTSTASQLSRLQRRFGATLSMGKTPSQRIPLYVVAYTGWNQMQTVQSHLGNGVDGILIIDQGLFAGSGITATGEWSLWGLVSCLHQDLAALKATSANPMAYAI